MKRALLVAGGCLLVVGALVAVAVQAQPPRDGEGHLERDGRPGGPPRGDRPGPPPPHPLLEIFDTDRDGQISAEEIAAAPSVLEKMDTNNDGVITSEELPRPPRPELGPPPEGRRGQGDGPRDGGRRPRGGNDRPEPRVSDRAGNNLHPEDHGRPVELIARDLGVTPEAFREAFKNVRPAPRGEQPSREQRERNRKVLSEALGVDPERLDAVMDKYRPGGPTQGLPHS